jgi:NAD(P)-dependent dehydrogenase (short-subunit alcohol dehydrogenase family)
MQAGDMHKTHWGKEARRSENFDMKVLNTVFVVTGGGSGMRCGLILNLLCRGASVAVVDINKSALEETVRPALGKKEK